MTHFLGSCADCKFCIGDVLGNGKCSIVKDPMTGTPMPVPQARMDTWQGYTLPCGYEGKLWQAK